MKDNAKMNKKKVLEDLYIIMAITMKEIGNKIKKMGSAYKDGQVDIIMKVNGDKVIWKDMAHILIQMEINILDNGEQIENMVKAFSKIFMEMWFKKDFGKIMFSKIEFKSNTL
jgi:hypothetical protein